MRNEDSHRMTTEGLKDQLLVTIWRKLADGADVWEISIPGREKRMCKGPEAETKREDLGVWRGLQRERVEGMTRAGRGDPITQYLPDHHRGELLDFTLSEGGKPWEFRANQISFLTGSLTAALRRDQERAGTE